MKRANYEAEAHCALRLPDGRIVQVRRGDQLPPNVETEMAEQLVAAGVVTRFEVI